MILVLSLAYLISNDAVGIPTVFLMAFAFGVADAFFYPASTSMLPSLVLGVSFNQVMRSSK